MASNYINTHRALEQLGIDYISILKKILVSDDKVATGNLVRSLRYEVIDGSNGLFLEIFALDYLKDVDEGTKAGAKSVDSLIEPIKKWMTARRIAPNPSFKTKNRIATNISKKINLVGIEPTYVVKRSQEQLLKNVANLKKLTTAAKMDIEQVINDALKNLNK